MLALQSSPLSRLVIPWSAWPSPAAATCQIVVMGLYRHEGAFWSSSWNKLDVLVTVCSVAACIVSPQHEGDQIKSLRSFRLLRALRPLRMVR